MKRWALLGLILFVGCNKPKKCGPFSWHSDGIFEEGNNYTTDIFDRPEVVIVCDGKITRRLLFIKGKWAERRGDCNDDCQ